MDSILSDNILIAAEKWRWRKGAEGKGQWGEGEGASENKHFDYLSVSAEYTRLIYW